MNIFVRIMAMVSYLLASGILFGLFSQVRAAALRVVVQDHVASGAEHFHPVSESSSVWVV
jgi:hypothetical protein